MLDVGKRYMAWGMGFRAVTFALCNLSPECTHPEARLRGQLSVEAPVILTLQAALLRAAQLPGLR